MEENFRIGLTKEVKGSKTFLRDQYFQILTGGINTVSDTMSQRQRTSTCSTVC